MPTAGNSFGPISTLVFCYRGLVRLTVNRGIRRVVQKSCDVFIQTSSDKGGGGKGVAGKKEKQKKLIVEIEQKNIQKSAYLFIKL